MVISMAASGSVTYNDTGCYAGGQPFLKEKRVNTAQYDIAHIPSAGVDGTGSINYGFRTQKISFTVVYVAGSEDAVVAAEKADSLTMANGPGDITVSGSTFKRCFIDSFEAKGTPRPTGTGDGNVWQEVDISFTCRGL